jgi:hypothetical protein
MSADLVQGAPLGPRVVAVSTQGTTGLLLTFSNGELRFFDMEPLLDYPAFRPLRNPALFQSVQVAYGTVVWPGDIDLCPDTLYCESVAAPAAAIA